MSQGSQQLPHTYEKLSTSMQDFSKKYQYIIVKLIKITKSQNLNLLTNLKDI